MGLLPTLVHANEIRCLVEAKDEDDLDDCVGLWRQPTTRLTVMGAFGAHVASPRLEGEVRPWPRDPDHSNRHLWFGVGVAVRGNPQLEMKVEGDVFRGSFAVVVPTGGTPPAGANAAWGYESNPSFDPKRVGVLTGLDADSPGRLRFGGSLHIHGLFGERSTYEILPEARVTFSLYEVEPYRDDAFRGLSVMARAWSNVGPEAKHLAAEARVTATTRPLRPSIGILVPFAVHCGLEALF